MTADPDVPNSTSALAGIRVLDLTQVLSGPFCTQILGDLGADVVKVEQPGTGDQARAMGPKGTTSDRAGFLAVNRNKRSITIDLRTEGGRQAFVDLAKDADIVVENYRPGVTERLGISYETLSQINPRLIYASISGFGQSGPYSQRPGYDLVAQAMTGLMSVTGEPGERPVKCGPPISDLTAGMFLTMGILAAVTARAATGLGQRVETSLYEAALGLGVWEAVDLWSSGVAPGPLGSAHRFSAPYQALATQDGYIVVAANNPKFWKRLCETLKAPHLDSDARFSDNDGRMVNRTELVKQLEAIFTTRPTDEWVDLLLEGGVPAGPIRDYEAVLDDPHTHERQMVVTMNHPEAGSVRALATPFQMSKTPASIRMPAPLLGEHTDELLAELGYDADRIHALRASGAL